MTSTQCGPWPQTSDPLGLVRMQISGLAPLQNDWISVGGLEVGWDQPPAFEKDSPCHHTNVWKLLTEILRINLCSALVQLKALSWMCFLGPNCFISVPLILKGAAHLTGGNSGRNGDGSEMSCGGHSAVSWCWPTSTYVILSAHPVCLFMKWREGGAQESQYQSPWVLRFYPNLLGVCLNSFSVSTTKYPRWGSFIQNRSLCGSWFWRLRSPRAWHSISASVKGIRVARSLFLFLSKAPNAIMVALPSWTALSNPNYLSRAMPLNHTNIRIWWLNF